MKIIRGTTVSISAQTDQTLALAGKELAGFLEMSPGAKLCDHGDIQVELRTGEGAGYSVLAQGSRLVFRGPGPVEVLYAVYTFAEECLGFCFFEPGRDRLEPRAELLLPEGTVVSERVPLLETRGFTQEFAFNPDSFRLAEWMGRNRLNYLLTWMKDYDHCTPEMKKYFAERGITIESGHHNFDYWIPAAKYYEEHPEYFAISGGKRVEFKRDENGFLLSKQLCTSNPGVRREIAKNMVAYCRAHPELKVISLIPNDGFGWCECPTCSAFYDKSRRGDLYSVSDHVYRAEDLFHDMVRDVAAQFNAEMPDITVTFCAYINYIDPSSKIKLNPGMAVHWAPYWRCINHAIDDHACPVNRRYMESLERWKAVKQGGKINIYEYYMGINFYISLPMVHHEMIFDEVRALKAAGADGILTQFHLPHWTAYGLNYYLWAKAAYGENVAAVGKAFRDLFGRDAAQAARFYTHLRELVMSAGRCHIPYPRSLLKRTKVEQYVAILAEARALAQAAPADRLRQNIVLWMEYCLRFKNVFDHTMEGRDVGPELDEFLAWAKAHADADVAVTEKLDIFFDAWKQQVAKGLPWYHFNIDWEDAVIRRHDELLNVDW